MGVSRRSSNSSIVFVYDPNLVILLHLFPVGGYYFGSVDQERYSIQRFARKINGRAFGKSCVSCQGFRSAPRCLAIHSYIPLSRFFPSYMLSFLAINYRLSPQYPFPCAIQDALAAYLYLIQPPPEAKHKPVKPEHIVIMGDSAGGGLSLATLQVIRDSRLPQCAGGVLISPWCDLTHSFPSIHGNTETVGSHSFTLLLESVLSLNRRTSFLVMVCRCTNLVPCGHLILNRPTQAEEWVRALLHRLRVEIARRSSYKSKTVKPSKWTVKSSFTPLTACYPIRSYPLAEHT